MSYKDATLAERLRTLDPKILYAIVIIAVAFPLLRPLQLPIQVSLMTRTVYNIVEGLPAGSLLWFSIEMSSNNYGEMLPTVVVLMKHIFSRPLKMVSLATFYPDGPMFYIRAVSQAQALFPDKKYGTDYAFMGFIPGDETAIASLASDFRTTAKTDYVGKPIDSLSILNGVKTAKDFALVFSVTSGEICVDSYVRQIKPYGTPLVVAAAGVNYPTEVVYFQSHQLAGLMNGAVGAAEYEKLTSYFGNATALMDALSVVQGLLIVMVVVSVSCYLASRRHKAKEVK